MLNPGLNGESDVNQALIDEFKTKEDVKMFRELPDCDDFRCFGLANEDDLSTVSMRVCGPLLETSWRTLRHHLLNIQIPQNLLMALRHLPSPDKIDEFKQAGMPHGPLTYLSRRLLII